MKSFFTWVGLLVGAFVALSVSQSAHAASILPHLSTPTLTLMGITSLGPNVLTLMDWAKRLDPDGKVPRIVELLSQTNEILDDMQWSEGNLATGTRVTVRTGLPVAAWRLLNKGVTPSKSTTAQLDEQCALLEAWSETDCALAELNGNTAEFRLTEAQAFIESMNQEMAGTLFYGNSGTAPEQFTGLAPRYSSLSAKNAKNVINAGGVGADNTSVWLIVWGPNTAYGIFPKGSIAGLQHKDLGEETVETTAGIAGARMRAYRDQWIWKPGLVLKDWRFAVRIANIDISDLIAGTGSNPNLFTLLTKATWRIPAIGMGRPAIYVNRTVGEYLDIQAQNRVSSGGQLSYDVIDGKRIMSFRGIPIRICDQLLETEAAVS